MAVPKKRTTKSRQQKRRANIFLTAPSLIKCPKCGSLVPPHTVCPNCGYYKNREVIDVLKKLTKKERKQKEKEIKSKSAENNTRRDKPLDWKGLSRR